MKHGYLFALFMLLLLPCMAFADSVTQEQALAKAMQFFTNGTSTRTAPRLEMIWDGETAATRSTTAPAFYVFNRTDAAGFVIIAGDEVSAPIIGYSHENNFESSDMPDNLRWWLGEVRSRIIDARESGASPHPDQHIEEAATQKVLQTAKWNQRAPYYNDCPLVDGKRCLTGCVQTAAAIICKYFGWPTDISGTVPEFTKNNIKVPARTLSGYNFDLMPMEYKSGYTDAQAAEVARLMADLGSMTEASYGTSATSASTNKVPIALCTYMRYSKSAVYKTYASYSDSEWIAMLKAEIDANRPCIYRGNNVKTGGGHAFVMDGYNSDGLIHFNWGWGGSSNGFFNISPTSSNSHTYATSQACVFGMIPDPDGASNYIDILGISTSSSGAGTLGLHTETTEFYQGGSFNVEFSVFNYGMTTYTGKVCLAHFSKDGVQKSIVSGEKNWNDVKNNGGYSYKTIACTITDPIIPGDYVAAVFWERNSQSWQVIRSRKSDLPWKIILMDANAISSENMLLTTTMDFDRKTRTLQFANGYSGVTFTLLNSAGSKVGTATYESTPVSFDCSKLAAGKYTVQISHQDVEPVTFSVVF